MTVKARLLAFATGLLATGRVSYPQSPAPAGPASDDLHK
jgi:hypothetical protein